MRCSNAAGKGRARCRRTVPQIHHPRPCARIIINVPLTVVLDKQHRVAYVSLVAIQVAKLIPIVQRLAAE